MNYYPATTQEEHEKAMKKHLGDKWSSCCFNCKDKIEWLDKLVEDQRKVIAYYQKKYNEIPEAYYHLLEQAITK
jgi:hypothetical protein